MLRWKCGKIKKNRLKNNYMKGILGVASIKKYKLKLNDEDLGMHNKVLKIHQLDN